MHRYAHKGTQALSWHMPSEALYWPVLYPVRTRVAKLRTMGKGSRGGPGGPPCGRGVYLSKSPKSRSKAASFQPERGAIPSSAILSAAARIAARSNWPRAIVSTLRGGRGVGLLISFFMSHQYTPQLGSGSGNSKLDFRPKCLIHRHLGRPPVRPCAEPGPERRGLATRRKRGARRRPRRGLSVAARP